MATSSRLKGNINPVFKLQIGAGSPVSYSDDVKKVELTSDDKDSSDLTFAEAGAGVGRKWTLKVSAITSFDTGAFYKYLWTNAGTEIIFIYGPWGNATATASQPHFVSAFVAKQPDFSVEASTDSVGAEFEIELECSQALSLVTS